MWRCYAQPVSWASLALVALTGAGVVTYYSYEKGRRVEGAPCVPEEAKRDWCGRQLLRC